MNQMLIGLTVSALVALVIPPGAVAQIPTASPSPSPTPAVSPSPLATGSPSSTADVKLRLQLNRLSSGERYGAALPVANQAVTLAQQNINLPAKDREKLLTGAASVYYRNGLYAEAEKTTGLVANLRPAGSVEQGAALLDVATLQRLDGRDRAAHETAQAAQAILGTTSVRDVRPFSVLGSVPIVAHYTHFLDGVSPGGYGRYSYVLFPVPAHAADFIRTLSALADAPAEPSKVLLAANIFELPVKKGHAAEAQAAMRSTSVVNGLDGPQRAAKLYDYQNANLRLLRACAAYQNVEHRACDASGTGPYVVVYGHPAAIDETTKPYLIVDMSNMHPGVYAHFLKKLKKQVAKASFTEDQGLKSLSDDILNITLTAADYVDPSFAGIDRWVRFVRKLEGG